MTVICDIYSKHVFFMFFQISKKKHMHVSQVDVDASCAHMQARVVHAHHDAHTCTCRHACNVCRTCRHVRTSMMCSGLLSTYFLRFIGTYLSNDFLPNNVHCSSMYCPLAGVFGRVPLPESLMFEGFAKVCFSPESSHAVVIVLQYGVRTKCRWIAW